MLGLMNDNIIAEEESSRLDVNGERGMQQIKFCIGKVGIVVHDIAIINIHDEVHARAVGEELPKVARIILRLMEQLHLA